jgi:polar amino acid transport system substrate-binding protein
MTHLAAAALSFTLLHGTSPADDLTEIKARGVLRVIAQKDEAPELFNLREGEPGFEREVLEGFARLHDLKLEPVVSPTAADRIPTLVSGRGDVIIGIVDLPERRKQVSFTVEVLPVRHMVLTHKPRSKILTVEAFRAAKVGAVRNTSWARVAEEAGVKPEAIALFADRTEVFEALRQGRIEATVITLTDGIVAMKGRPGLEAGVMLGEPGSSAFAVRKSDAQLLAGLDQYLGNFRKSPSWDRLLVKYFGDQALEVLGRR